MSSSFAFQRQQMVEQQLRAREIHDARVLAAMNEVPREAFVPDELRDVAYEDRALAIACEQTISQPYIVALMTAALELAGDERVLEIGTGSGYQAAVLAALGVDVFTIERHEPLATAAQQLLAQLGCDRVRVKCGDGTQGWPNEAPFDRVIITAGGSTIPPLVWNQLLEAGILVAPLGDPGEQTLMRIRKIGGQPVGQALVGCRFVPLIGGEVE